MYLFSAINMWIDANFEQIWCKWYGVFAIYLDYRVCTIYRMFYHFSAQILYNIEGGLAYPTNDVKMVKNAKFEPNLQNLQVRVFLMWPFSNISDQIF
jgi:hypothetical protein